MNGNKNKTKIIILVCVIAAVVIAGVVTAVILLNKGETPADNTAASTAATQATTVAPTTAPPTTAAPTTEVPTTVAPTTEPPTTVVPSTEAKHEYTAMELIDKDLSEIMTMMGGKFDCGLDCASLAFGTNNVLSIYNENVFPGMMFTPNLTFTPDYNDLSRAITPLLNGEYNNYRGITVRGKAKLNDTISADMTYNQLAKLLGDFDMGGFAQESFAHKTNIDGHTVVIVLRNQHGNLDQYLQGDSILHADTLHQLNPLFESFALFKEEPDAWKNFSY